MRYFADVINALANAIGVGGRTFLTLLACVFILSVAIIFHFFNKEDAKAKFKALSILFVVGLIVLCFGYASVRSSHGPNVPERGDSKRPDESTSPNTQSKPAETHPAQVPTPRRYPVKRTSVGPPPKSPNLEQKPSTCVTVGGFCVQGGSLDHPSITNTFIGPPAPLISWQALALSAMRQDPKADADRRQSIPIPSPREVRQVDVSIVLKSKFTNASFRIRCNRPCFRVGTSIPGLNVFGDSQSGQGLDLILDVTRPTVLPAGTTVIVQVQAEDGLDPGISAVEPNF